MQAMMTWNLKKSVIYITLWIRSKNKDFPKLDLPPYSKRKGIATFVLSSGMQYSCSIVTACGNKIRNRNRTDMSAVRRKRFILLLCMGEHMQIRIDQFLLVLWTSTAKLN
jgi:hypothetical protein